MKKFIVLILMTMSISLSTQNSSSIPLNTLIKSVGGQIAKAEMLSLTDVDLNLINSLSKISDYNNLSVQLNKLPKDKIRFIDSIDYHMIAKDTLLVKIYSQDYAYLSRNGYKMGYNLKSPNVALKLCHIYYDMEMKSDISDYTTFRNHKYTYSFLTKEIKGKERIKRTIILRKNSAENKLSESD